MTSVLANQCDIGFAGPEASIYVYNEGKEDFCQVFAQMTQKDGSFLVARDKTENFSWQDLKGKLVIPGRKGGVPYMTLEYVLKKNGIDPQKDTTLDDSIKFDLMAGAFASGDSDYVTLFEPTASMTQNQQKGYIVASVGEEHNSKEIAQAIQSFFPDTDIEMLEAAIQSYQDIDAWSDTPILKEEAFNRLQEVMTMAGELQEKVPYEKIVNNQYAEKAIQ